MTAPIILRHKDATSQAKMYAGFAAVLWLIPVAMIAAGAPSPLWYLLIHIPALLVTYWAVRLATLRVRLDERGIWEPNPFALTMHTPWSDVLRIRQGREDGAMGLRFLTVDVVHLDGTYHQVVALNLQAGASYAQPTIKEWVQTFRDAKAAWS